MGESPILCPPSMTTGHAVELMRRPRRVGREPNPDGNDASARLFGVWSRGTAGANGPGDEPLAATPRTPFARAHPAVPGQFSSHRPVGRGTPAAAGRAARPARDDPAGA